MEPHFNQSNIDSLLGHLAPGSMAHDLVSAVSGVTPKEEAAAKLAALLDKRVAEVREGLHADS
jgi:hypothetical protein